MVSAAARSQRERGLASAALRNRQAHFFEHHLHVVPDVFFGGGIAQQVGRVVSDENGAAAIAVEAAAELADGVGGFEKSLCGDGADTDDVFGPKDFKLPLEEGTAILDFGWKRIPVFGRAAFEDVHDIDVPALPAACFDDLRQELSGSPDERLALAIFVGPRCLPEEDDPGPRAADAEDGLFAAASEVAAERAAADFAVEILQELLSIGRRIGQVAGIGLGNE